jgi:hypothetical protein
MDEIEAGYGMFFELPLRLSLLMLPTLCPVAVEKGKGNILSADLRWRLILVPKLSNASTPPCFCDG